jgi:hypothetical protein
VLLLSLTRVGDPDAWGHLTQGREIWEARGLPETEALTYPATERPYTYTSWLFGVVCYLVHLAAGGAGLVLLKAGLVTLAFGLLLADALVPHRNRAVAVAAASAAVLLSQYRFVLRPDLMAMVFLAFSILSLNAYVYERRRLVFFLPLVHWLWANSHSSIVLMLVPYLAHLVGGVLQIRFERGAGRSPSFPTAKQLGVVGLLLVLSLAATLANPNSTGQLFVGGEILAQPSYSSGILELQPPTPSQKMALVAVAACVLGSFALRWQPAAIVDLLVVLPFLVLPFFGSRFAFYAGFVGAPVLARNVSSFLRRRNRYRRCGARAAAAAFAGWLVVYGSLALARVEPFGATATGFGLGFDTRWMPKGAVEYMDEKGIEGRVFNTFRFGQYVLWTGFPRRTVFIEGRGALPPDVLERYARLPRSPQILEQFWAEYRFESVLLENRTWVLGRGPIREASGIPVSRRTWALVYWDDVSRLLLRRGGRYQSVIDEDEYEHVDPRLDDEAFARLLEAGRPVDGLVSDLDRNLEETGSRRARRYAQMLAERLFREGVQLYLGARLAEARQRFEAALDLDATSPDAWSNLGYVHFDTGALEEAKTSFERALSLAPDHGNSHYGLAMTCRKRGERDMAILHFRRYLELVPAGRFTDRARLELAALERTVSP